MGRHRHRHRLRCNRPKHSDQILSQFSTHALNQDIQEAISYEARKEIQKEYLRRYKELEDDVMARSIFITNVRDARHPSNRQALRTFLETKYGQVEECFQADYINSRHQGKRPFYPPVRVIFRNAVDVKLLFASGGGGGSLVVRCSVGCKNGCIRIQPSKRDQRTLDTLLKGNVIRFTASGLSLGHWLPHEKDKYISWKEPEAKGDDEWLEENRARSSSIGVSINLPKRCVVLDVIETSYTLFDTLFGSRLSKRTATFRFKDIDGHLEVCHEKDKGYSIVFSLKNLPQLHEVGEGGTGITEERTASFDNFGPGSWTCRCFKVFVSNTDTDRLLLSERLDELKGYGILRSDVYSLSSARAIRSRCIGQETDESTTSLCRVHGRNAKVGILLRSLLDRGRFCWFHALNDEGLWPSNHPLTVFDLAQAPPVPDRLLLKALQQMIDGGGTTKYPCKLLSAILRSHTYENYLDSTRSLPSHCLTIPRVILTPCRQVVLGMEIEMSNRVNRLFINEAGFRSTDFVRLRICDENENRLFRTNLSEELVLRFKEVILHGILINGARYSFLAFSSSQLKELSMWLVAPPRGWDVAKIREKLGDFSGRTASKFAARIGQCFSTTIQTLPERCIGNKKQNQIRHQVVDDVISICDGKQFVHSDGTGIIDLNTLHELLKLVPWADPESSTIQIRFGGAKGTVTAYDFKKLPNLLRRQLAHDCNLVLRPSMIKFEAPFSFLEVCRAASNVPYYLNRNVILLLGMHGVPDEVFIRLQEGMLNNLDSMMSSRHGALKMLSRLGGPDQRQKNVLLQMLRSGFSPTNDPFLFSCLLSVRHHHFYNLRKKARIFVEKGAVLLGALDETGLLPRGCVFIQIMKDTPEGGQGDQGFRPLVGPVMVTKHPVMHPGDVRMLCATDVPQLRHIKNVIVFSQKGTRPEPGKMSGSDLDGDEFAVAYDPDLFLNSWNCVDLQESEQLTHEMSDLQCAEDLARKLDEVNSLPLDYDKLEQTNTAARILPNNVDEQDRALMEHFFDYARSDSLGHISMLWQDYASSKGAGSAECVELAALHSVAVDFAKTGIPATIPDNLKWTGPHAHWREVKGRKSYHCESIVGKLYDMVVGNSGRSFDEKCSAAICGRKFDKHGQILSTGGKAWQSSNLQAVFNPEIVDALGLSFNESSQDLTDYLLGFADQQRLSYEDQVAAVMNKFHLRNEGELFTGCIRKYHRFNKKRQHSVSEEVRRLCESICSEYRTAFFRQVLAIAKEEYDDETTNQLESLRLDSNHINLPRDSVDDGNLTADAGNEDEIEEARLLWVERIATELNGPSDQFSMEGKVRRISHMLAAAYYCVSYSPELRTESNGLVLFSFPWVVPDVIACGRTTYDAAS